MLHGELQTMQQKKDTVMRVTEMEKNIIESLRAYSRSTTVALVELYYIERDEIEARKREPSICQGLTENNKDCTNYASTRVTYRYSGDKSFTTTDLCHTCLSHSIINNPDTEEYEFFSFAHPDIIYNNQTIPAWRKNK